MNVLVIRKVCRPLRIFLGSGLVGYGLYSGNVWFYLGVAPLVAGIANFCPLCKITKQCDIL